MPIRNGGVSYPIPEKQAGRYTTHRAIKITDAKGSCGDLFSIVPANIVRSRQYEVRSLHRFMFGKAKYETADTTDFALRTDDFALATDFALRTDDFALATDFALRTDDFALATDFGLLNPQQPRPFQRRSDLIRHIFHAECKFLFIFEGQAGIRFPREQENASVFGRNYDIHKPPLHFD